MKILDICCGIGIAAVGIDRALKGIPHEIIGIDIKPHPEYPFTFICGDATRPPVNLQEFSFIWASPPCQKWVDCSDKQKHPDLITPLRTILKESGVPYVIENVKHSPLHHNLWLVGPMVGLPELWRERRFECSFPVTQPPTPKRRTTYVDMHAIKRNDTKHGKHVHNYCYVPVGVIRPRNAREIQLMRDAMGITWPAPYPAFTEGIPPAMSEYVTRQFLTHGSHKRITIDSYLSK